MWRKGNFCALLVRNSTEVSQKSKIKLPYDPAFLLRVFNLKKLKKELKEYEIPKHFKIVDELPYTQNGKYDFVLLEKQGNEYVDNLSKDDKVLKKKLDN